jgi:hypothetical protein
MSRLPTILPEPRNRSIATLEERVVLRASSYLSYSDTTLRLNAFGTKFGGPGASLMLVGVTVYKYGAGPQSSSSRVRTGDYCCPSQTVRTLPEATSSSMTVSPAVRLK